PTGEHKFEGNYPRAVSELPYHLCEARMWGELNALLCSVTFVEAKATYVLVLFSFRCLILTLVLWFSCTLANSLPQFRLDVWLGGGPRRGGEPARQPAHRRG